MTQSRSRSSPMVITLTTTLSLGALAAGCETEQPAPAAQFEGIAPQGGDSSGSGGGSSTGGLRPLSSVPVPQPVGGDIINVSAAIRGGPIGSCDNTAAAALMLSLMFMVFTSRTR